MALTEVAYASFTCKAHAYLILGSESGKSLGDVLKNIAIPITIMLLKLGTDELETANNLTQ